LRQPGRVELDPRQGLRHGLLHPADRVADDGEQEAVPATGNTFPTDEKNMRRWRGWWKVANQEQAVTFWLIGTLGIVVLAVLGRGASALSASQARGFRDDFITLSSWLLGKRCRAGSGLSTAVRSRSQAEERAWMARGPSR
jgi:hypothetical protein